MKIPRTFSYCKQKSVQFATLSPPCEKSLVLNLVKPLKSAKAELLRSQSRALSFWNWFSECEPPFIDKLMVLSKPAEASAHLLGLGSNPCIPATSSTCSTKTLLHSCRVFFWQRPSRASERNALIAECFITFRSQGTNLLKHWLEHPYHYNDDPYDGRWKCEMYSSDSSNTVLRSDASRKFFLAQPYTMQLKKPCIGAVRPCQQYNQWMRINSYF